MRGILFIFFLLMAGVGSVLAQPNDCAGQPGGTGTHTVSNASSPFDPTSLNSLIDQVDMTTTGCGDYVFTLESTEDTLFLSSAIDISPQEDIPFTFVVERAGQRVVLRRSSGSPATVIQVTAPNVTLSNQTYMGNGTLSSPLLDIQAGSDNAVVRSVHFEMTAAAGVGVNVAANMVLLERSYFRSQLGTYGDGVLPVGVQLANSASQVEIRASLFNSAGAVFNSHGFHLAANTFVGNMGSGATLITVNAGNATPNFLIQHNHIAPNSATTPIEATGADANDVIRYNAHTTGAVATGTATDLGNVPLPRGLSDYALGDYPLDQMRTDLSLPESGSDFGSVPQVYNNFSSIPSILNNANLTADWIFSGFTDFESSQTGYSSGMQVGCFANFGNTVWRPSPVDTLAFGVKETRIGRTVQVLDTSFYAGWRGPNLKYYLMSQDSAILTTGNDLSLSGSPSVYTDSLGYDANGRSGTNFDTSLHVSRQLRLNGQPIYVKMVHHVSDRYAHSLDTARSPFAIARVEGLPQYPVTDFGITDNTTQSDLDNGIVRLQYSAGVEVIDSLHIQIILLGQTETTIRDTLVPQNAWPSPFRNLPQGSVEFRITPVGWVDGTRYEGDSTFTTGPFELRQNTGDSLWVDLASQCDPTNDGTQANPYCDVPTALSRATAGITIAVRDTSIIRDLDFDGRPQNITLVTEAFLEGDHRVPRPRIRGLTLNQTGTKVRGFIIEKMSEGNPAVTVSAGDVVLEGNLFRSANENSDAEVNHNGAMISILGTTADNSVTIANNVIYGGFPAVNFASPATVEILNNAFVKPSSQNSIGIAGFGYSGSPPNVAIANNFFTGIGAASTYVSSFDQSFISLSGSTIMERNAFVGSSPLTPTRATPTLEDSLVTGVGDFGIMNSGVIGDLYQRFTTLFTCGTAGCSPLFAGSSPNYVVSRDFIGLSRSGIPEVGAFESSSNNDSHGSLTINVESGRADFVHYQFTTLNYEPSTTPNAFIWWELKTPGTDPDYNPDSNSIVIDLANYPDKGPLGEITTSDSIKGLGPSGNQLYRVCYGFGNASPPGDELCKDFTTPILTNVETCYLGDPNTNRCPAGQDSFSVEHPGFADGKVPMSMDFQFAATGSVSVSGGVPVQSSLTNLTIDTALPFINVTADYTTSTEDESENYFTLNVNLKSALDFSSLELVRESGGEVYLVPSWRTEGNLLHIEGKTSGIYYFVQVPSANSGEVTPVVPSGTYTSGTNSVDLQLSGSQFVTSNPLILVNVIPAGSMAGQSVFNSYFAQNVMLTAGLENLGSDLAQRWGFNYFQRLQTRYSQAVAPSNFGQPPIDLSAISSSAFSSQISVRALPAAVSNRSLPDGSVSVNLNQNGGYVQPNSNRKITRGLEFVTTVFDAGRVTLSRSIMPTEFEGDDFFGQDINTVLNDVISLSTSTWHLFSYPWSESEAGESLLYHLAGDNNSFSDKHHRIWKRQGTGFLEWEGGGAAGFTFDEGNAVWVAAINQNAEGAGSFKPVSSGGQSMDTQPFTINIAAGAWTEFGLPFNFPIRWADIANATSSLPADFTIYAYNKGWKDRDGIIRGEAWTAVDASTILQPWTGYVARASTATNLTIPVVDNQRSSAPSTAQPKRSASPGYLVKVTAENSSGRQSLVLGKQKTKQQRWAPPGVPGQNFNLSLQHADAGLASDLRPLDGGVEGQWALKADAWADEDLVLGIGELQGLPDTAGVYLVEELAGSVTELTPGENHSLSPEALSDGAYSIVVGSESYLSKWLPQTMAVLRNVPNPFSGVTRFSANLPLAYREGDTQIRLHIYNLRGETVYRQTTSLNGKSRRWEITWDGRDNRGSALPGGAYIAELDISGRGLPSLSSRRKVVKVR